MKEEWARGMRRCRRVQTQQTTVMQTSKWKGCAKVSFFIMLLSASISIVISFTGEAPVPPLLHAIKSHYNRHDTHHWWQSWGQIRHTQMNNTWHEHATWTASGGNTTSNRTCRKVWTCTTWHRQATWGWWMDIRQMARMGQHRWVNDVYPRVSR